MVFKSCFLNENTDVDPNKCYNDFKENMELVKRDIEENINESLNKLT
jgi:hypothetical protein